MEIILVIAAVLILGKASKSQDATGYKVISASILGAVYFFVWPFCYYYLQLLLVSEVYVQVSFVVLVIISMLFVKALLVLKCYEIISIISVILFLMSWIISTSYGIDIKDYIAEQAGYFDSNSDLKNNGWEIQTKVIRSPRGGYTLIIPTDWDKKIQINTQLPFYRPKMVSNGVIEFRPKCNELQQKNITEIVDGLSKVHNDDMYSEHSCFIWGDGYACKVSIKKDDLTKRVRWVSLDKKSKRLFELDFITSTNLKRDLALIDSIFYSVKISGSNEGELDCPYSIDWY